MFYNKGARLQAEQIRMKAYNELMLNPAAGMAYKGAGLMPQTIQQLPKSIAPRQEQAIQKIRQSAKVKRRQFISLRVRNTAAVELDVVLFDALQTYQDNTGTVIAPEITITGLTKPYEVLQRRFLGGKTLYFDQINIETDEVSQFDRPISIFEDDIATAGSRLVQSLYPSEGLNSTQDQANRVEVVQDFMISGESALVFKMEPESEVILRMFLSEQVSFS